MMPNSRCRFDRLKAREAANSEGIREQAGWQRGLRRKDELGIMKIKTLVPPPASLREALQAGRQRSLISS